MTVWFCSIWKTLVFFSSLSLHRGRYDEGGAPRTVLHVDFVHPEEWGTPAWAAAEEEPAPSGRARAEQNEARLSGEDKGG